MKLVERVQQVFAIDESFVYQSEDSTQHQLAPILRNAAIQHLATGKGVVARGFRGEYAFAKGEHYKNFLDKQAKNGVWATYIEATALGELLNCNIVVTEMTKGKKVATYCLYRSEDKDTSTIHLYNSNNTHWYTANGYTIGDGNCLYNAIAKEIQRHAREELKYTSPQPSETQYLAHKGFFGTAKSSVEKTSSIIENQKAIEAAIAKVLKPSEIEDQQQREQQRISQLSQEEQNQITSDYKYALKLAEEEMSSSLIKK